MNTRGTGSAGKHTQARAVRSAMHKMSDSCLKCATAFDPYAPSSASDAMHVDHIRPSSWGGPDELYNYQPLCGPYNVAKGDRSDADYRSAKQKLMYPSPERIIRQEKAERKRDETAALKVREEREAQRKFSNSPAQVSKRAKDDAIEAERVAAYQAEKAAEKAARQAARNEKNRLEAELAVRQAEAEKAVNASVAEKRRVRDRKVAWVGFSSFAIIVTVIVVATIHGSMLQAECESEFTNYVDINRCVRNRR